MKTRHADGHTVFGSDDELTLKFEGTCARGRIARHLGTAEQFPGVVLEGTFIFREEQPAPPAAKPPTLKFNPAKLPKLPKRSR